MSALSASDQICLRGESAWFLITITAMPKTRSSALVVSSRVVG